MELNTEHTKLGEKHSGGIGEGMRDEVDQNIFIRLKFSNSKKLATTNHLLSFLPVFFLTRTSEITCFNTLILQTKIIH